MDQQLEEVARSLHKVWQFYLKKILKYFNPKQFYTEKAMEGIGSDKERIIKEIVSHPNAFRKLVKEKYFTLYGKVNYKELFLKLFFEDEVLLINRTLMLVIFTYS